jgi:hypothetical protein
MLRFDRAVNNILNRLIFEQDESVEIEKEDDKPLSKEDAIIADIQRKNDEGNAAFFAQAKEKFNSGGEYVDKFIRQVEKLSPNIKVNESTFSDKISKGWDYAKEKGNELLVKMAPTQDRLADHVVEKMDNILTYVIGVEFTKKLNDEISENFLYKVVAIFFDPTGVLSWPYLRDATEAYEKHKGTEYETIYQLNLLAAQLAVVPTFAFKPIFGILTLPLRLLTGSGAKVMEKLFGVLGATKISTGIANWIRRKLPFRPRNARLTERPPKISKASKASKAEKIIPKAVKAEKLIPKVVKAEKIITKAPKAGIFGKTVIGAVKLPGKLAGKALKNPFKTATILGSGDIPKTLEDLKKSGEDLNKETLKRIEKNPLGRFSRFGEISTQRP